MIETSEMYTYTGITLSYVTLHYIIIRITMVEYGYHVCTILMWCFVKKWISGSRDGVFCCDKAHVLGS